MRAVFDQPAFRTIWLAQFVSVFGDFLALFGVISLITFRFHGSPVDVAAATVAYLAPFSFTAPVAGVLVDRWPVKRVMIASDLIRAVIAASLVLVHDTHQIWAVMALLGFVSSFFGPAQSVTIRVLVPPQDLLSANAMLSQAFYAVRISAPLVAGALVSWLTEKACFWLDAASFLFSAAMIARLAIVRPASAQRGSLRAFGRDFVEGNRFIFAELGFCNFPANFCTIDPMSPERRSAHLFVGSGDQAIMFGGETDCGLVRDTWTLDVSMLKWSQRTNSMSGLTCFRAGRTDCNDMSAMLCQ